MKEKRGAALLLCIAFTAAAISMVLMLSTRAVAHVRQSESASLIAAAFAVAEVAQAQALADLRAGGTGTLGYTGNLTWTQGTPGLPTFDDPAVDARTDAGPPAVQWFSVTLRRGDLPADLVIVYAFARAGQIERRLETVVRIGGAGALEIVTWRELPPATGEEPDDARL